MSGRSCLGTFVVILALAAVTTERLAAAPIIFSTALSGSAESPPNASPATGEAFVTIDVASMEGKGHGE
jgi:hypothetical protein